jgi:opacity protein-like surface antigen
MIFSSGSDVTAGVDYALTDGWIGRVEYRYANFDTFSYSTTAYQGRPAAAPRCRRGSFCRVDPGLHARH